MNVPDVVLKGVLSGGAIGTHGALERPLPGVRSNMSRQVGPAPETLVAEVASEILEGPSEGSWRHLREYG